MYVCMCQWHETKYKDIEVFEDFPGPKLKTKLRLVNILAFYNYKTKYVLPSETSWHILIILNAEWN